MKNRIAKLYLKTLDAQITDHIAELRDLADDSQVESVAIFLKQLASDRARKAESILESYIAYVKSEFEKFDCALQCIDEFNHATDKAIQKPAQIKTTMLEFWGWFK